MFGHRYGPGGPQELSVAEVYKDVTESVGKIKFAHEGVGSKSFEICDSADK